MVAMAHEETQLIRKPEGGIIRNYQCRVKATNIKSIVRPDKVHHSLYSGVHFMCYKEGYVKKTLMSKHNPLLFHYSTQAWEVQLRKHQRRASPASKPFSGGLTIYEPSLKWYKAASHCTRLEPTLATQTICTLTFKALPNCTGGSQGQLLVVGTGGTGSGMTWVQRQLSRSLARAKADPMKLRVDWKAAILRPPVASSHTAHISKRFVHLFHQVRHPLRAIAAIMTYTDQDWQHVAKVTSFKWKDFANPLARAMAHWVLWNQYIGFVADWRYRVEDVDPATICDKAGLLGDCKLMRFEPERMMQTPRAVPRLKQLLTWADLDRADAGVARMVRGMAQQYGYRIPPEGPQAVQPTKGGPTPQVADDGGGKVDHHEEQ